MRTIRVTGKGDLKLRPDIAVISITLTEIFKDYAETLRRSTEKTEKLRELLTRFGFVRSDLKTVGFNIDTEYESYRDGNEYKQRFAGYRYRHSLKLEFPIDNDRLGKILYALANSGLDPEFNIGYSVTDREAAKNELLAKAVLDAGEKAAVLAKAAGLTLGAIQTVDYTPGDVCLDIRPMNRMMANGAAKAVCADETFSIDIEPENINVSDTVSVVWEIS